MRETRAVPLRLVAGRGHYEAVIGEILQARRSVWIATANLKDLMIEDHRARPGRRRRGVGVTAYRSILSALDELAGRGVELRLLHAAPPSRPFVEELARFSRLQGAARRPGALQMRLCPRTHLKVVVIDGALAYLGSANFTGAGLGVKGEGRRNFELGIVSRDDVLLDEVQQFYDHLWNGAPCATCRLRDRCPEPLDGRAGS